MNVFMLSSFCFAQGLFMMITLVQLRMDDISTWAAGLMLSSAMFVACLTIPMLNYYVPWRGLE